MGQFPFRPAAASMEIAILFSLILVNGIFGYRVIDLFYDGFYYKPITSALNLWLGLDGVFLSLYGVGCVLFLIVLLRSTRYSPRTS